MCLIIAPGEQGVLLPRDVFDFVYKRNDDGFGAMWNEDGRVKAFKKIGMTGDEIYDMMQELAARHEDVIFHMRYKTHGQIIPGLAHPFRILHKSRHGRDLFFMHNGVLGDFGKNLKHGQSDTTVFKDKILIPLLTRNPDALDDPEVMSGINRLTTGSRLVFMDSNGKTYRTSQSSWNDRYGCTLSNTYMLPTVPYSYKKPEDKKEEKVLYTSSGQRATIGNPVLDKKEATGSNVVPFDQPTKKYELLSDGSGRWVPINDDLDDDLPSSLSEPSDSTLSTNVGDAPYHEKLRYARIIQNLHGGNVLSREQMCGDILGMSEMELFGLCKEDADSTSIIIAELFEMFLELNSLCSIKLDLRGATIDADTMLERGATINHRQSMKKMVDLRRAQYEKMLEEKEKAERSEQDMSYAQAIREA